MRLLEIPKLEVAALRFTESARARITKSGGSCLTIDELIMKSPSGTNTLLLRGPTMREAKRHFGVGAGIKKSKTKPYVRSKHSERSSTELWPPGLNTCHRTPASERRLSVTWVSLLRVPRRRPLLRIARRMGRDFPIPQTATYTIAARTPTKTGYST